MIAHIGGGPLVAALATVALIGTAMVVLWFQGPVRRLRRRARLSAGGLLVLAAAVSGPAEMAAERTFTAHMAQHLAILVVAPALLAAGRAAQTIAATAHRLGLVDARRPSWLGRWRVVQMHHATAMLATATIAHALALSVWHLPAVFATAVEQPVAHGIEHASMFAVGLALFVTYRNRARRAPVAAFAATFATAVHGAALGALITFASIPTFDVANGPTTLQDQQVAGLIMWIPTGIVYIALAAYVVWRAATPAPAADLAGGLTGDNSSTDCTTHGLRELAQ